MLICPRPQSAPDFACHLYHEAQFCPLLIAADLIAAGVAGAAATCTAAQLIDPVLSAGAIAQKSGYNVTLNKGAIAYTGPLPAGCVPGTTDGYQITAYPISIGTTGQNSFCTDASGVVRKDPTGATPAAGVLCPAAMFPLQ